MCSNFIPNEIKTIRPCQAQWVTMGSNADCKKFEANKSCQDNRWCPFVSLMALANVLGLEIHSFYPVTAGFGKYA